MPTRLLQQAKLLAFIVLLWLQVAAVGLLAGDLRFKRHVLNEHSDYSAAALIDVNRDGRVDIVCGGEWYEAPSWQKHFVADIPRIGGRPDGFSHLEFDVNRDGWLDIITVNYRSRSIKWMEHPGKGLGPWTIHTASEPGPMETGRLVDIDGDGNLDLLPNGANFAAWWEFRWNNNLPGSSPAWIRHDLPASATGHGMGFGDIDGDGRGDIIGQNGWLRAPTDPRGGDWQWHPEFQLERGSIPILVVDPDGDGDNDLVWCSAHGFGVYWHEQSPDREGKRVWTRHAIDTSWSQGHSPLWADMDGDGQAELITGKRYMAHGGADPGEYDPIVSYRYQFDSATRTWKRWTLSPAEDRVGMGLDPKVADIDGDGDLDLLTSGRSGLYWLENLGPAEFPQVKTDCPTYHDHPLMVAIRSNGSVQTIDSPERWGLRRQHIMDTIENAHGTLPDSLQRVPLQTNVLTEAADPLFQVKTVEYSISADVRSQARLFVPNQSLRATAAGFDFAAIVCMFDAGDEDFGEIAGKELAARGFVCIVPEAARGQSTTPIIQSVWQAMRAADLVQALDGVDPERIGFLGNADRGQLGPLLAAYDQRFVITYSDATDAVESSENLDLPYSLAELLAASAPRTLHLAIAEHEKPAFLNASAQAVAAFKLRQVPDRLSVSAPSYSVADHRKPVYQLLEQALLPRAKGERAQAKR